ncbi:murein hydrolase activator EnvC family protein [Desulfonatronum thiosulfatophilum]|uniref:murein hydrolase activator EnvC family protein n=1 Tax=Desulfonatronum thiosulfatophilum TaxID=617002 RepID=UPI00137B0647|nr:peptidoglycan DD-metalloendopeptidase family protein [Desulfonatronum thiosulfatophilum]
MSPITPVIFLLALLAGLFLGPRVYASPKTSESIVQSLEEKQRDAHTHEKILQGLTEQERKLFGNLQDVEVRIRRTTDEIQDLETELVRLRHEENRIQSEYRDLVQERTQTGEELRNLLTLLWPVHLQGIESKLQDLTSWDEADRQFHWLSRIYGLVQERIERLQAQARELALGQVRLERSRAEIDAQIIRINKGKDQLLAQKLDFLRRVQEVRAQKISTEEQVKEILQSIADLNYQLQTLASKTFSDQQGRMSWPGQGRIVQGFQPQASPPHRGLSLQMGKNDPVRAISPGKVVHSDLLRGYGHVVIVYHGQDYYSLYAFLNNAVVSVGQDVDKDEKLGQAGYYPKVDGPGLYFELRFHQNPVNPDNWLVAK